jgi:hypothetical protein
MKKLGLALVVLMATASTGLADNRVEHRQDNRIERGVKDGTLTRGEARTLRRGQHRIDKLQERAKSDGDVTAAERQRIRNAQHRESMRIWRNRQDAQRRY